MEWTDRAGTGGSCNQGGCNGNLKSFGAYDLSRIALNGRDRTQLNWNELSIPEILNVPEQKPDIEQLDQVYVDARINCAKLIETPYPIRLMSGRRPYLN